MSNSQGKEDRKFHRSVSPVSTNLTLRATVEIFMQSHGFGSLDSTKKTLLIFAWRGSKAWFRAVLFFRLDSLSQWNADLLPSSAGIGFALKWSRQREPAIAHLKHFHHKCTTPQLFSIDIPKLDTCCENSCNISAQSCTSARYFAEVSQSMATRLPVLSGERHREPAL